MKEAASLQRSILITGSTLGVALANVFAKDSTVASILLTWKSKRPSVSSEKIILKQLDVTEEGSVQDTFAQLTRLDGVINTVGFLHNRDFQPEKSISRFDPSTFHKNLETNTLPTLLLAKHSRHLLKRSSSPLFIGISAKVGSIEDNRLGGWYSYRASKAALNMALKTLAIEWSFALPSCTVAALHPGTVASPLSEPFTNNQPKKLFSPNESARKLKLVIDNLTPEQTGRFWAWDGTEIPW